MGNPRYPLGAEKCARQNQNEAVEMPSVPASSIGGPFAFIPAFDFSPEETGLVSVADGHSNTERKIGNVRKPVGEIQNVQR